MIVYMKCFKAVVIYNREINESKSCMALANKYDVIIFDNSDDYYRPLNEMQCKERGFTYLTAGSNVGLSRAYNEIVKHINTIEEDYYICWFDDDTELSDSYFQDVSRAIEQNYGDVLLPVVMDCVGFLSPSKIICGFYPRRIKNLGAINNKNLTAINSGMCVSSLVYKTVEYDEKLFLDCVDHIFISKVKKAGFRIEIMEATLHQSFSETALVSCEQAEKRFKIYAHDFCSAYSFVMPRLYLLIRALRRCLMYRTLSFLKITLKELV